MAPICTPPKREFGRGAKANSEGLDNSPEERMAEFRRKARREEVCDGILDGLF
jgi:hypothetical protein